jgi:hypothetical protein
MVGLTGGPGEKSNNSRNNMPIAKEVVEAAGVDQLYVVANA